MNPLKKETLRKLNLDITEIPDKELNLIKELIIEELNSREDLHQKELMYNLAKKVRDLKVKETQEALIPVWKVSVMDCKNPTKWMRYNVELVNRNVANNTKIVVVEAANHQEAKYKAEQHLNPSSNYLFPPNTAVYITTKVTEIKE